MKPKSENFLEEIVAGHVSAGEPVVTRFPPEPNGYLHIGHAAAICLNFGLAEKFGGRVNLRFDDTNPETESTEYVDAIRRDVEWLGFRWDRELYASDHFEKLYEMAVRLIRAGLAYVDDSSAEEIAADKGTPTEPGRESPYRNRSVEENLDLFERMKNGEFADGSKTLRAKIDMSSPNMHMRDPLMYRIKHAPHHRTGDKWCVYPMYDFAHGQCDSIEGVTHSICTLEFEPHRPLYDWFISKLGIFPSRQYEFARRNLSYAVTSKRKLMQLVNEGVVDGWDDPRMPTISGMRRRGYTAKSIRAFCEVAGVSRRETVTDMSLLEFCVREDLNRLATRRMVVLNPVRLVIENYDPHLVEELSGGNNPEDPAGGVRTIPFSGELLVERDDFMETPADGFFRLAPGRMVRLMHAYIVKCESFEKDRDGNVTEIRCTYVPDSRSGSDTSGIRVKGTIHFVSAAHAVPVKVNVYDRLFSVEDPAGADDFMSCVNRESVVCVVAMAEPAIVTDGSSHYQFVRNGYFYRDGEVFNKTVGLRDSWSPAR